MPTTKTIRFPTPLVLALGLVLGACAMESGDVTPADRQNQAEIAAGQRVEISFDADAGGDDVRAVAEFTEGLGNVAAAKVKAKKQSDGPMTLVMELWGEDLPGQAELEQALRSEFEFLADASIAVTALDAASAPDPADESGDPEEVKQKIIDRLRAEGVEGDIQVDVKDGENGREVDVRVEKHCDGDDSCSDE